MKTTMLGRTGLRVSRIAFGTWQLGGEWGPFDEDVADRDDLSNPWQAALSSAVAFTLGAVVPLIAMLPPPWAVRARGARSCASYSGECSRCP